MSEYIKKELLVDWLDYRVEFAKKLADELKRDEDPGAKQIQIEYYTLKKIREGIDDFAVINVE